MSVQQGSRISGIDLWFELTARGSTYSRQIRGSFVTFFTMAYIVVLNPLIIGAATDVNAMFIGENSDPVVAIAAGLGLKGFVAFTLAPQPSLLFLSS